jgi:hypothetical protein
MISQSTLKKKKNNNIIKADIFDAINCVPEMLLAKEKNMSNDVSCVMRQQTC